MPESTVPALLEVQQLSSRYNIAWDTCDPAGVCRCFTADGVFLGATGEECRGPEEIAAEVLRSRKRFGTVRHFTSGHVITEESRGELRHQCYLILVSRRGGRSRMRFGEYADDIVVDGGEWRFRRRSVRLD